MQYVIKKKSPRVLKEGKHNHQFCFQLPHELFEKAKVKAVMYNKSLAEVIREFLENWTDENGHKRPEEDCTKGRDTSREGDIRGDCDRLPVGNSKSFSCR